MKNLKLIFLALGCMAALSLTSCLKDSDDDYNNGLTPAQISQCYNAVKGSYTGKLVYPSSNTKYGYTDTIDVSWSIGADTMLVINSFSSKVIAEQIKDTELKEALMQEEKLSVLKNYLHFIKNESEVQFLLAPQTIEFPVFYKDKTHTLSVIFWYNDYSFGYKTVSTGTMGGQLVMAYAFLDGDERINYFNSTASYANIPMIFSTNLGEK